MAPRGIQEFYYTRTLPARAVAIAQVTAAASTPANLIDINNTPYLAGSLGIWKAGGTVSANANFVAPDLNQSVQISGDVSYLLDNQFFQITNQFANDGTPLYYCHKFGEDVAGAVILDLMGNVVASNTLLNSNMLFHDMDGKAYQVRYADTNGRVQTKLLQYGPVLINDPYNASSGTYSFFGRALQVFSTQMYSLRFTANNGYMMLAPYETPSYLPWYPRIRYSLQPPAPEYRNQNFQVKSPYLLGSWVAGTVLSSNLIEFERKQIYTGGGYMPDIVVFDKNYHIKYALEGTAPGTVPTRGSLYAWKRQQILDIEPVNARVLVRPIIDPTDIVFGFYLYGEPDVIYTGLDVNPITNSAIRGCSVQFYYKAGSFKTIYHQVFNQTGPIAGQTNDPTPPNWTTVFPTVFAQMVVGISSGTNSFVIKDIRTRGGGLAPNYLTIPEADNFWDVGYLDGRPYPVGGALVLYLPTHILNTMTRDIVNAKVNAVLPMGTIATIKYYDPTGEESV